MNQFIWTYCEIRLERVSEMVLYDEKVIGIIETNKQLIVQQVEEKEDVTFKASFTVLSDVHSKGKITALFDLIVLGDIVANELYVKGRLVCMGNCRISENLTVQNSIWANTINAKTVVCHDRITAQEASVDSLMSEGNIVIGKTLAVEEKVECFQKILCGETAYGAGKLIADSIITAEPLDLDDGEEALETPYIFDLQKTGLSSELEKESIKYAKNNDYNTYLDKLQSLASKEDDIQFSRFRKTLLDVEKVYPDNTKNLRDVILLVWMLEINKSGYFENWEIIDMWLATLRKHFDNISHGILPYEEELKPATKLLKGYVVSHLKYGRGIVKGIQVNVNNGKKRQTAVVDFDNYGEKKFPIPSTLSFFMIISEDELKKAEEVSSSLECNVNSYSEWITALSLIYEYQEYLGETLYCKIYDLLLAKIGLKARFVEERLKAKGWQ